MYSKILFAISLWLLLLLTPCIATMPYEVTAVLTNASFNNSVAYSLNDTGQIVGEYYYDTIERIHGAFFWANGQVTSITESPHYATARAINNEGTVVGIDALLEPAYAQYGYSYTLQNGLTQINPVESTLGGACDINNTGQIIGEYQISGQPIQPFIYTPQDGLMDLNYCPGADIYRSLAAINDLGVIVGGFTEDSHLMRAYQYDTAADTFVDLHSLLGGAYDSYAFDINNQGQIVGSFTDTTGSHINAFLYDPFSGFQNLGSLGDNYSQAHALNESGQVVGDTRDPDTGRRDGFLWQDGVMVSLDDLLPADSGWDISGAYDINESGQIVGYGFYEGKEQAFLLTPVPEPAALSLLTFGALTITRRRH